MNLWDWNSPPDETPTEFAQKRLAKAREAAALWGRREAFAATQRAMWETRIRQYENRLGNAAP